MGRLIPLLFLADVALVAVALIGCLSAEEDEIRSLPRIGWIFVILFFPVVGPVAWFAAGRPEPVATRIDPPRSATGPADPPGERGRQQRRPLAPDDDPEFLRSLDSEQAKRDRELLQQWEDDLRRREDDLRGKETNGPAPDDGPAKP